MKINKMQFSLKYIMISFIKIYIFYISEIYSNKNYLNNLMV